MMEQDKFALVEKILRDIDKILSKNADLHAFDIIPVDTNFQNKSPVLYMENCLGLESWCVKHVYLYCHSELMDKYFAKPKRKAQKLTSIKAESVTRLLNVALLINPDSPSLWNKRRELVIRGFLEKSTELRFTRLVLSRKAKCNEAFAYRRWLIIEILKNNLLQSNYLEDLVNEELNICEITAEKSPNNYHSWNHRMWILSEMKTKSSKFSINLLYSKEYEFSERWCSKHISDFSCFHYRQFCLKNLISSFANSKIHSNVGSVNFRERFVKMLTNYFPPDYNIELSERELISYSDDNLIMLLFNDSYKTCECNNAFFICRSVEILVHELLLNDEYLRFYKFHETLWYHRRFIVHELFATMFDYFGLTREKGLLVRNPCKVCNVNSIREKQAKIVRYDSNKIYSCILFKVFFNHEKKFIEERRNDGDNYTDRHEKYLKFIEGIN